MSQQLPDRIQEKIKNAIGKAASKPLLTHCRREIFQAAWLILIQDPEFLDAYVNGMIVDCIDGVRRRVFPRFFTYSADYPEKYTLLTNRWIARLLRNFRVLVATIKDFGSHPCPRCLVAINEIHAMGRDDDRKRREESRRCDDAERRKKVDEAREWIYDKGYVVNGDKVEDLLKDQSMVPTKVFVSAFARSQVSTPFVQNAFSLLLSPFGFDFHKMLTVDLLHEVELGVWKALIGWQVNDLMFPF